MKELVIFDLDDTLAARESSIDGEMANPPCGTADCRVGVARLDLPESLPLGGSPPSRKETCRSSHAATTGVDRRSRKELLQPSMISSSAAILIVAKVEKVSEIA